MEKTSTKRDYALRIMRVIDYIHTHPERSLKVDVLAEVACFSPHHFHRVYRGITGEPVSATVRRFRLHRASGDLVSGQTTVTDIARRAGYASLEAFSRAFTDKYGMPPSSFREASLAEAPVIAFQNKELDEMTYTVIIEENPHQPLIGIPHQGSYMGIGQAFERLYPWAASRNLIGPETQSIGIYYDDPDSVPAEELRSFAALVHAGEVELDDTMERRDIPAGQRAVLQHKGPYSDLHKAWRWFYSDWLPDSGQEPTDAPCYEIYLNNPRMVPPTELLTHICMPIKAQ
ncbi:MAG: AraC family transcriptional regulator [Stappiaceae bacterium]